jgi:hypothetical protein
MTSPKTAKQDNDWGLNHAASASSFAREGITQIGFSSLNRKVPTMRARKVYEQVIEKL